KKRASPPADIAYSSTPVRTPGRPSFTSICICWADALSARWPDASRSLRADVDVGFLAELAQPGLAGLFDLLIVEALASLLCALVRVRCAAHLLLDRVEGRHVVGLALHQRQNMPTARGADGPADVPRIHGAHHRVDLLD